jgi:hypothetical protein
MSAYGIGSLSSESQPRTRNNAHRVTLTCTYPPCSKSYSIRLSVHKRRQARSPRTYCCMQCAASDRSRHQQRPTLEERFWANVIKGEPDECWGWRGWTRAGYGKMYVRERDADIGAHVISWFIHKGVWPTLDTLHTCDNPPCTNLNHLFEGTAVDNAQDMVRKGRHSSRTHPEKMARGDRNGARTHPERLARGDDHWTHRFPERVRRGEQNNKTKLTNIQREELLRLSHEEGWSQRQLATRYSISKSSVAFHIKHDPYP